MNASMEQAIAREAGTWLFRLREDDSPECRTEFEAWLKTSPQHVAEFLLATTIDVELGALDSGLGLDVESLRTGSAPNVVSLPAASSAVGRSGRRRLHLPMAIAASMLLAVLAILAWRPQSYGTDVGEQRSVKLDDGSVVQLNTRSRIDVRYTHDARVVQLLEGEALFTVAPETSRPFSVESGAARVQAIGTQFNVYLRSNDAKVSVVEGRVRITSAQADRLASSGPLLLDAGQEAAVSSNGHIVKSAAPLADNALAWRQRHLEFHSATVAEVAEEFNRYNRLQIHVADGAIANRSMSGLFDADEPQSLVDFLVNEGGIRAEKRGNVVTLSSAR